VAYIVVAILFSFTDFPSSFTAYGGLLLVNEVLLPHIWRNMISDSDDVEYLGNFIIGLAQVTSYMFTSLGLRYGLWLLSLGRCLLVSPITHVVIFWFATTIEDWKSLDPGGKQLLISLLGRLIKTTLLRTARQGLQTKEALHGLVNSGIDSFNQWEAKKIEERKDPSTGSPEYKYIPLKLGGKGELIQEIRLLKLSQRALFTELRCSLINFSIHKAPSYEAISYTWGKERPEVKISMDGSILIVTRTVSDILHYRQTWDGPIYFWIDAICINQKDEVEKSHQVNTMRSIYQRANRVIVWLGTKEKPKDARLAREMLAYLSASIIPVETLLKTLGGDPGWSAIHHLFEHPWFSRIWVVQEIAVASTVNVMYGGIHINWDIIAAAIKVLMDPGLLGPGQTAYEMPNSYEETEKFKDRLIHLANASFMNEMRMAIQTGCLPSLGQVLSCSTKFKSTDLGDKVFAVLGIASDSSDPCLAPNYGAKSPTAKVYQNAMRYLITEGKSSYVLQLAGLGSSRSPEMEATNLPSWVVDWSAQVKGSQVRMEDIRRKRGWTKEVIFTDEECVIKLAGSPIDRISDLEQQTFHIESTVAAGNFSTTAKSLGDYKAFYDETQPKARFARSLFASDEAFQKLFWRILTDSNDSDPRFSGIALTKIWKELLEVVEPARSGHSDLGGTQPFPSAKIHRINAMVYYMGAHCGNKRFCVTERGHFGLVPENSKIGDSICQFDNLRPPFVVRPKKRQELDAVQYYALVGCCRISGLIDGQKAKSPGTLYYLK
jgi:hypothetical protein